MTPFRAFQLATAALVLAAHVWIVQAIASSPWEPTHAASGAPAAFAQQLLQVPSSPSPAPIVIIIVATPTPQSGDNDGGDNDGGDNDSSDNNGNSNGNGNGNSNSNANGNGNRNSNSNSNSNSNDNTNDDGGGLITLPPRTSTLQPADPGCSTPGQEVVFVSSNRRIVVRVFPPTEPPVRVEIRPVFDLLPIPLPPGQLVGLLIYDVVAGICSDGGSQVSPVRVLPSEVNLSFQYTDVEAFGLDESRFEIAHLDFETVQWTRVEKQELNAGSNVIASSVAQTGYYAVYQRP